MTDKISFANKSELAEIIKYLCEYASPNECELLFSKACAVRDKYYKKRVYFRGLIEFSNYCKNNCYYCGIRNSNQNVKRYRLSKEEILKICERGYLAGLRTFVLQGGEDLFFDDSKLCDIIHDIKSEFPDCALTLSVGERGYSSYNKMFLKGANRYLLRHETASKEHYESLHPPRLTLENRKRCLYDLKKIGFQVGAGFMVGSPNQTYESLAEDFMFLRELNPQMVGIGPFIPHKDTRFCKLSPPVIRKVLVILSLVRVMLPKVLMPATTALGTIDSLGYEKGLTAGANVIMPNITPKLRQKDYCLYDNKLSPNFEIEDYLEKLNLRIKKIGLIPDYSIGDYFNFNKGATYYE